MGACPRQGGEGGGRPAVERCHQAPSDRPFMQEPTLPPEDPWPSWATAVLVGIFTSAGAFVCTQLYESSISTIWLVSAWILGVTGFLAFLVGAIALGVRLGTSHLRSLLETMIRSHR